MERQTPPPLHYVVTTLPHFTTIAQEPVGYTGIMGGKDTSDRYPRHPRGPKHSGYQILKIPLMLTFYSIPSLFKLAEWSFQDSTIRMGLILFCLVAPVLWLTFGVIHHSETLPGIGFYDKQIGETKLGTIIGLPQSGRWAPESNPVEPPTKIEYNIDPDLETLRVEYQSLVSEAQYRDKLLLRTTYFALGAITLFAGILSTNTFPRTIPAILMLGSIVMLAFTIATNSYKDSRDALWDRIGRLENTMPELEGNLTTFNTIRAMDLRLLNTVSLSSYSVGLTIFITVLTYGLYVWSVLFFQIS
jgi:hypothetical protein